MCLYVRNREGLDIAADRALGVSAESPQETRDSPIEVGGVGVPEAFDDVDGDVRSAADFPLKLNVFGVSRVLVSTDDECRHTRAGDGSEFFEVRETPRCDSYKSVDREGLSNDEVTGNGAPD